MWSPTIQFSSTNPKKRHSPFDFEHENRNAKRCISERLWSLRLDDQAAAPGGEAAAATMVSNETGVIGQGYNPQEAPDKGNEMIEEDREARMQEEGEDEEEEQEGKAHAPGTLSSTDARAIMLNILLNKRKPRDKVEEKLENLIRSSLQQGNVLPEPPRLFLTNAPWDEIEEMKSGASKMDTAFEDLYNNACPSPSSPTVGFPISPTYQEAHQQEPWGPSSPAASAAVNAPYPTFQSHPSNVGNAGEMNETAGMEFQDV